ncbi:MAG: hypothetical protein GEV05_09925 [Betaproteobacteria bacterium]|nr:hypothetical protein [Betaproteobacteria bacterium]
MMNIAAMSEQYGLDVARRDCLFLAIERSIRVRVETDFFSWAQGSLQAAIPHDVLLCACFDPQGRLLDSHVCSPIPMLDGSASALVRTEDGLLHLLLSLWDGNGRSPLLIDATAPTGAPNPALAASLQALAFSKLLAHGSWAPCGSVDTFFVFAGIRCALDAKVSDVVEIVVPHLRAAFVRLQPRKMKPRTPNRARALTNREREILLQLQHGRSNAEIGGALAISPLTVKNHVQKILRKLGVRNRTQAVALDMSQRWHRPD